MRQLWCSKDHSPGPASSASLEFEESEAWRGERLRRRPLHEPPRRGVGQSYVPEICSSRQRRQEQPGQNSHLGESCDRAPPTRDGRRPCWLHQHLACFRIHSYWEYSKLPCLVLRGSGLRDPVFRCRADLFAIHPFSSRICTTQSDAHLLCTAFSWILHVLVCVTILVKARTLAAACVRAPTPHLPARTHPPRATAPPLVPCAGPGWTSTWRLLPAVQVIKIYKYV